MSLASRMMERFSKRLARFVAKEKANAGCAKVAIKRVATKLGMSTVAVYRAMNGYGPVKIQAHHYAALVIHTVLSKAPKRRATKAAHSFTENRATA